jgi:hypothetical protein
MKKIRKKEAEKMYKNGENVYLLPHKLPPYIIFSPTCINKIIVDNFLNYILFYEQNYCNKLVGKKVQFYKF